VTIPTPKERPELYDGYDAGGKYPADQVGAITPPHIKESIGKRNRSRVRSLRREVTE
jgi:hypothetical protein